jgi:hypothetical protein
MYIGKTKNSDDKSVKPKVGTCIPSFVERKEGREDAA